MSATVSAIKHPSPQRRWSRRRRVLWLVLAVLLSAGVIVLLLWHEQNTPLSLGNRVHFFSLPDGQGIAQNLISGPDGQIWFTRDTSSSDNKQAQTNILRIAADGTVSQVAAPAGGVNALTSGPDGNLWFAEMRGTIGRLTPAGKLTEFRLTNTTDKPYGLTFGPDGNLWFTQYHDGTPTNQPNSKSEIGRLTLTGKLTNFPLPRATSGPTDIVSGPDGNLWFTEAASGKIGRITPAGKFSEFTLPGANETADDLTRGPDGNLWFIGEYELTKEPYQAYKIGRITPAGQISEFALPDADNWPANLTSGPDGNLWFVLNKNYSSNWNQQLGRITPAGQISKFELPTPDNVSGGIITGKDGNLWLSSWDNDYNANPSGIQMVLVNF